MGNLPPKYPSRLLAWFCHDDFYEELQGDLEENFFNNSQKYGLRKARRIYTLEVLRLLRPSVIKKLKTQSGSLRNNNIAMIKNYLLVAFRSLSRNRFFSVINIFGLAMSMAVALITIAFVTEINSYDQFHADKDRIYRINNLMVDSSGNTEPYASTSVKTGNLIREQVPGLESVATVFKGFNGEFKTDEANYSYQGYYVSPEFLEIFSFPAIQGNLSNALTEPNSVVITENLAQRIFNTNDVVGEVLKRGDSQFKITAVLADIPKNSHLQFEALGSMSTVENAERYSYIFNWNTMWSSYAYFKVQENFDFEAFDQVLNDIAKKENEAISRFEILLRYEGLTEIFPGDGKYNQVGTVVPKENIDAMVILTIIVIFSACFNYANLSIARSLKRAKEIGVRKVVGAKRSQVFTQFITEAVLVSLLSLVFAYFLFRLIKPEFLSLNYYISRTTTLDLTLNSYLYFFVFAVLIGLLAGCIPSLIMTRFKPVQIIKGITSMKVTGSVNIRKFLVGVQFVLSIGFAVLVTLSYKQYQYALNFNLGYQTESIFNVELHRNDFKLVEAAFSQVPEVEEISGSGFMPSTGSLNSDQAKVIGQQDSMSVYSIRVNENYIANLGHQLIAGENLDDEIQKKQMVVNEEFIKKFNLGRPEEAIGTRVKYYDEEREIVGVVKNFHYGTIYNDVQPFSFIQGEGQLYYINLKLNTDNLANTMAKLDEAWKTVETDHDLKGTFFSEDIERTYQTLSSSMKTYGLLAIVAIGISILGLLGMAVYTAESKVKELTIRKVLGATYYNLLSLLSRNFLIILVIATAIAIPTALYIFRSTLQNNMEYVMTVGFWELASGALLVIIVAIITIGSQATKAARMNPASNLRNE